AAVSSSSRASCERLLACRNQRSITALRLTPSFAARSSTARNRSASSVTLIFIFPAAVILSILPHVLPATKRFPPRLKLAEEPGHARAQGVERLAGDEAAAHERGRAHVLGQRRGGGGGGSGCRGRRRLGRRRVRGRRGGHRRRRGGGGTAARQH